MADNWVANLDMLAGNGVIDYDGAAFLRGTPPRYIGNPAFRVQPYPGYPTAQKPALNNDTYTSEKESPVSNPPWKKILFGTLIAGLGLWGVCKLKGAKIKEFKPVKKVTEFFNNVWGKIKNLFTKRTV